MNILGVDFGTKRIGLSWVDTKLDLVLPYGIIAAQTEKEKIIELSELIATDRVDKVVVGFPLGLNSKENANTERVKKFIFQLQKHISVPVLLFDERFSSQAGDALGKEGVSRDEKAAMAILDGYLERSKK